MNAPQCNFIYSALYALTFPPLCLMAGTAVETATDQTPFVTCEMKGSLGNQIFQVATTLAYAWDHGARPLFPALNQEDFNLSYNRDRFFFRLDTSELPRPIAFVDDQQIWFFYKEIPTAPDLLLIGYFQAWQYFDHHRDRLLEVFAPSESIRSHLHKKYADLIAHPNTVGLHVRTFNLSLHQSKFHPFLGMDYYQKATDLFPDDTLFVVFSDRIQWCKIHLPKLKRQFVFIEDNDAVEDLFLMSMMKHQIIANSSFSWWGAYLNTNPNQRVIAPISWMHPSFLPYPLFYPNPLYPTHWTMQQSDYDEPYPYDMAFYELTRSLDGN